MTPRGCANVRMYRSCRRCCREGPRAEVGERGVLGCAAVRAEIDSLIVADGEVVDGFASDEVARASGNSNDPPRSSVAQEVQRRISACATAGIDKDCLAICSRPSRADL